MGRKHLIGAALLIAACRHTTARAPGFGPEVPEPQQPEPQQPSYLPSAAPPAANPAPTVFERKTSVSIRPGPDGAVDTQAGDLDAERSFWMRAFPDNRVIYYERCPNAPGLLFLHSPKGIVDANLNGGMCKADVATFDVARMVAGEEATRVLGKLQANTCCRLCFEGNPCGDSCIEAGFACTKPPGCAC